MDGVDWSCSQIAVADDDPLFRTPYQRHYAIIIYQTSSRSPAPARQTQHMHRLLYFHASSKASRWWLVLVSSDSFLKVLVSLGPLESFQLGLSGF